MKHFIITIATLFLLVSCCIKTEKDNRAESASTANSNIGSYITNAIAIEQKKHEFLSIPDNKNNFIFSEDTELQTQDPHAYWLMNRMMQMIQEVKSAEDCWAWILAMDESIATYNHRLNRKIGSIDAAINAVNELIDIYTGGNQPQMNTACYVMATIVHYKAIYAYYKYIDSIDDYSKDYNWNNRLKTLCFYEFKEWYNIHSLMSSILRHYTSTLAQYSARSMDINDTINMWLSNRLMELQIEENLCNNINWTPYKSEAEKISPKQFDMLLNDSVWREDSSGTEESTDDSEESYQIIQIINYYKNTINNWREVREQICMMLPVEKQYSYQEITKQIHTRLYKDLEQLQTRWY